MTQPSMSDSEVAQLKELLELAKTTERKAEELAEIILEIERKYEKRLAKDRVAMKFICVQVFHLRGLFKPH